MKIKSLLLGSYLIIYSITGSAGIKIMKQNIVKESDSQAIQSPSYVQDCEKEFNNENLGKAFSDCSIAAQNGDADAQFYLGWMYYDGKFEGVRGLRRDTQKAFEWIEKSALQGNADAQFNLGEMYYDGEGVRRHKKAAVEWLEKAAQQGIIQAQYKLGWIYDNDKGIVDWDNQKINQKVFEWYEKAAQQGHIQAQYFLSGMYSDGRGVEQNDQKAFEWLEKVAQQKDDYYYRVISDAQLSIAKKYDYGKGGVRQDKQKAKEWYGKACDSKEEQACDSFWELDEAGY